MMEAFIICAVLLSLGYYALVLNQNRTQIPRLLKKWATDNRMEIISWEYRYLFKGPFFGPSGAREVCHILCTDNEGKRRSAMVRCGGGLPWIPSKEIEVHWEN